MPDWLKALLRHPLFVTIAGLALAGGLGTLLWVWARESLSITVPLWTLVLTAASIPGFVWLDRRHQRAKKPPPLPPPAWHTYTTDIYNDIVWEWNWREDGHIGEITGYCPDELMELTKVRDNWRDERLVCRRCGRRLWNGGRGGRVSGLHSDAIRYFECKKRTGEWQQVYEKSLTEARAEAVNRLNDSGQHPASWRE